MGAGATGVGGTGADASGVAGAGADAAASIAGCDIVAAASAWTAGASGRAAGAMLAVRVAGAARRKLSGKAGRGARGGAAPGRAGRGCGGSADVAVDSAAGGAARARPGVTRRTNTGVTAPATCRNGVICSSDQPSARCAPSTAATTVWRPLTGKATSRKASADRGAGLVTVAMLNTTPAGDMARAGRPSAGPCRRPGRQAQAGIWKCRDLCGRGPCKASKWPSAETALARWLAWGWRRGKGHAGISARHGPLTMKANPAQSQDNELRGDVGEAAALAGTAHPASGWAVSARSFRQNQLAHRGDAEPVAQTTVPDFHGTMATQQVFAAKRLQTLPTVFAVGVDRRGANLRGAGLWWFGPVWQWCAHCGVSPMAYAWLPRLAVNRSW